MLPNDFPHLYSKHEGTDKRIISDGTLLGYYNTFRLGRSYETAAEMVTDIVRQDQEYAVERGDFIGAYGLNELRDVMLGRSPQMDQQDPDRFIVQNRSPRDSSVGGNDVINPLWQFCRYDDIIHPNTAIDPETCTRGLGRCYEEMYDRNNEILEMCFGVPYFTGMAAFMTAVTSKSMYALGTKGDMGIKGLFDAAKSTTLGMIWQISCLPMKFMWDTISAGSRYAVSQYVEFEPSMFAYYRQVNSILMSMAVSMQLHDFSNNENKQSNALEVLENNCDIFAILDKRAALLRKQKARTIKEAYENLDGKDPWVHGDKRRENTKSWFKIVYMSTLPGMIHTAFNAAWEALNGSPEKQEMMEEWTKQYGANSSITNPGVAPSGEKEGIMGLPKRTLTRFQGPGLGSLNYVRFRIDKIADVTDTFSNSTGDSEFGSKLNALAQEGSDKAYKWGDIGESLAPVKFITDSIRAIKSIGTSVLPGAALYSATSGKGTLIIPEIWKDSNFSTTRSITMTLRSPYGDAASKFQAIYVPLAMLLAATLPRGTGRNQYRSPFMVRAYCRSKFAIPYGIVSSLSIRRGNDEYGWSYQGLPNVVQVDMDIKDLTPVLFLGITDQTEAVSSLLRGNDTFQEYIGNITGLALWRRDMMMTALQRRLEIFARLNKTKWLGNTYVQGWIGTSGMANTLRRLGVWGHENAVNTMSAQNQLRGDPDLVSSTRGPNRSRIFEAKDAHKTPNNLATEDVTKKMPADW